MENTTPLPIAPIGKSALQYAIILSMTSLFLFAAAYFLKIDQNGAAYKGLNWVTAIAMFVWHYKTKVNSNRLTLGTGVKLSVVTGLITGLLSGLCIYLFITFLAMDYPEQLIAQSVEQMRGQGLSEELIAQNMGYLRTFTSPAVIAGMIVIITPLSYLIIGLIISAIIKNDRA